MKRYLIFLFLAFIFFLGAVTFYVNTIIIQKHLKKIIIEETQNFLGRRIQLSGLHYNPLQGFILNQLTIFEQDSPDTFLQIPQAKVQILIWPWLLKHKIILSSVSVDSAQTNLIHYVNDQWNFTDILEHRAKTVQTKQLNVFLSKIKITNSQVTINSLEDGFQFSDEFKDINIALGLSSTQGFLVNSSLWINDTTHPFSINGNYNPRTHTLTAEIQLSQLNPLRYYRLLPLRIPITLEDLIIHESNLHVRTTPDSVEIKGRIFLEKLHAYNEQLSIKTNLLSAEQALFSLNTDKISFQGNVLAHNVQFKMHENSFQAQSLNALLTQSVIQANTMTAAGSVSAQYVEAIIPEKLSAKGNISLKNWTLSYDDQTLHTEGVAELAKTSIQSTNIDSTGDFLFPSFSFTQTQNTSTAHGSLLANNLNYRWPSRQLTGQIVLTDWQLQHSPDGPWTGKSSIQGHDLFVQLPQGRSFKGDASATSTFELSPATHQFQLKGDFQVNQGQLALSEKLSLNANPSGSINVISQDDPLHPWAYSGQLNFNDGTFQGMPISPIEKITGTISFQNNQLATSALSIIASGMPTQLTGTVQDFSSPYLDLNATVSDFDLTLAKQIIPSIIQKYQLNLEGSAQNLNVIFQGTIKEAGTAKIEFSTELKDSTVTSAWLNQSLSQLNGGLSYKNKTLSWANMNIRFNEQNYLLTGELTPGDTPIIDTTIENDDLKVHTRFNHSANTLFFHQLSGRYKNVFLNLQGTRLTTEDGSPYYDFTGDADLDLQDLPLLFVHLPDPIKACRLKGKTNIKGRFAGDLKHWQDWQLNLTGASAQLSAWGLNFKNAKFNIVQQNNLLKPFHFWSEFYDGELNLVASLDTSTQDLPLDLVIRILNTDLKKFTQDTPFKKQTISGVLSSTGIFHGPLADLKNINGKGGVEINDGLLWEIDLLKGLGGILLIPEYKDIIFTQAGMNFTLDNGLLTSENIQLVGPSLSLYGKGSLNFNQDQLLNLWLTPDFNSDVILKSSSLKKSTTAIITQTEKFMSVEVSGTLSRPKYKVNKSPVKILQKTGGVILENVSQFFQNIF